MHYSLFIVFFMYHLITKYFFSLSFQTKISVNNIFLAKYFFNAKFCFLIAETFKTSVQSNCVIFAFHFFTNETQKEFINLSIFGKFF